MKLEKLLLLAKESGHNITMNTDSTPIKASCQCTKWRQSSDDDAILLAAYVSHCRRVMQYGNLSAAEQHKHQIRSSNKLY